MQSSSISVQLSALYLTLYSASLPPTPMFWVADFLAVGNEKELRVRLLRWDPSF